MINYYYIIILYFLYIPMEIYFNILVTEDFGIEYSSLLYLLLLLKLLLYSFYDLRTWSFFCKILIDQ